MKKMICLVFMICFLTQMSTTYAQSNQKLDYPSNRNKSFVSGDVFYEQLDKKIYKEYKNAAYSVRKKILFKEVPDEEFSFLQKTAAGCRGEVVLQDSFIHPDRQVYFFASFSQNEVEELQKYIVIDAETKKELQSGKSYHRYDNLYKK
ncbi:hypothetical protein P4U05_26895 [Bacillus paranthracis]|uniref:hypothetical protein n=1 Tax=Bacillus TaxID=1386 RepID=UPI000200ED10|nr:MULTISPECIES: hypothetical protein [Bacillus]ADY24160.1 hypothetical protein YBT020_24665 [Bacillus thuringiensis serovar finitimus YBT-020]MDA1585411.1 hypothetical protein [Bacillus cereus group sp. TH230-1LC]MRC74992.1 hypothetical protein [Bacillus thuringiensis]OTX72286.1 hypothetical protein BK722_11605 [Bacillus thuringiensis serovar finitimus]MCR6800458.1 hypothetical protein [Bacillus paranthracis]